MRKQLINVVTGRAEYVDDVAEDRMNEFIPQDVAAQVLYRANLAKGMSPYEATIRVIEECLGSD